jgi:hypothetical protein
MAFDDHARSKTCMRAAASVWNDNLVERDIQLFRLLRDLEGACDIAKTSDGRRAAESVDERLFPRRDNSAASLSIISAASLPSGTM